MNGRRGRAASAGGRRPPAPMLEAMQPVAPSEPPLPTPGTPISSGDWLQTSKRVGAGSAVAGALFLLLQFLTGDLSSTLRANADKIEAVASALATHQSAMEADQAARLERDRRELGLLRAICLGVNKGNRAAEQLCGAQ